MMGDYPQYEFGMVTVPAEPSQMIQGLDKIGKDGWEPWGFVQSGEVDVEGKKIPALMLGVKRIKRLIQLATNGMTN